MAEHSKLNFINADGEVENSTSQDTLAYLGLKTVDKLVSQGASDDLTISTGSTTDGGAQHGHIILDPANASGPSSGVAGRVVLNAYMYPAADSSDITPINLGANDKRYSQLHTQSANINSLLITANDTSGSPLGVLGLDGSSNVTLTAAGFDKSLDLSTAASGGADDTGDVTLKSGNSATGATGDAVIASGTTAGVRGNIKLDGLAVDVTSSKIINLIAGAITGDAVEYDQMVTMINSNIEGLHAKEATLAASTANIDLATGTLLTIDTIVLSAGDRVLVMNQTLPAENGIYLAAVGAWTRATDFDETAPINEIQGAYVPVQTGATHAGKFFVQSGTVTTLGTDAINFVFFNAVSTLSAGLGIDATLFGTNVVAVDLLANGGLKFTGQEVAVDYATGFGIGSSDDLPISALLLSSTSLGEGADVIGVPDQSGYFFPVTSVDKALADLGGQIGGSDVGAYNFTENNVLTDNASIYPSLNALDLKWGDLGSIANGEGASIVAIEDAAALYAAADVEAALAEVMLIAQSGGSESYTTDGVGVAKGDLLVLTGANIVSEITTSGGGTQFGFAMAESTVGASLPVDSVHDGQKILGILSGFTAGIKVYYDSTQTAAARFVTLANAPTVAGSKVWQVGIAANATDLVVDINFIKKNA